MFEEVHPKLPSRNLNKSLQFYSKLGFKQVGGVFPDYLMLRKESVEIHFFLFANLNPLENYGQVYIRVEGIDVFYQEVKASNLKIHPNGPLEIKPWGQKEFALLDPDNNLLTFGEAL